MSPKPQFVWHESDVEAGMIVCRAHRGRGAWTAEGWTAKWTHKIGFVPGDGEITRDPAKPSGHFLPAAQYCHIALTDGMVYWRGMTKAQMAAELTAQDMIPMPYSWWLKMARYLRSQTNPGRMS